ncbi:MAG: hypothetical protein ABW252_22565 [Polyangiales bacterium]
MRMRDRAIPHAMACAMLSHAITCAMLCLCGCTQQDDARPERTRARAQEAPGDAPVEADARWWSPGDDRVFPRALSYANESGVVTTLNLAGPTATAGHPFFTPLGDNGRACVTCHQPADGMSLSLASIRERWDATRGGDPLFATIDGANCPSLPRGERASHSLLLERGVLRIARPWPPRDAQGTPITPEFTLEVVRDPAGCNLDPVHGLRSATPTVSVYRRPRPATNLKYVTAVGFAFDPKNGLPMPLDPETGTRTSGNVLSDVRAPTLAAQARDAMRTHLALHGDVDPAQLAAILAFEQQLFTAQSRTTVAGSLSEAGARGGPELLASAEAGVLQGSSDPIWSELIAWKDLPVPNAADAQAARRRSIGRGAALFSTRTFLVTSAAGVTDLGFGNPVRNSCAFCHNMHRVGLDVAPGQVDIGTSNEPAASESDKKPVTDLPLFKLTCREGARAHPHLGRVIFTHDPGYALTTGKCIDIGKITAQQMRGLAARAPYFAHGGAKTLRELVDFYDTRFEIELSDLEKDDLTHFLEAL